MGLFPEARTGYGPEELRGLVAEGTNMDERIRILMNLNIDGFRRLVPDAQAAPDHVILMSMHKARYEHRGIPAEIRHASGRWLRERGLKRMNGLPLLPEGELP